MRNHLFNKKADVEKYSQKEICENMWWNFVTQNLIFEGIIQTNKQLLQKYIKYKGYTKTFEEYAWEMISKNDIDDTIPAIPYLLDAFVFDHQRIVMDNNYDVIEEK